MTASITTSLGSPWINSILATVATHSLYAALIKTGYVGTYGVGSSFYSDLTGNNDEVSGTGYTAGGQLMTGVSVVQGGTTSNVNWLTFTAISWTAANGWSADGAMFYDSNNSNRVIGIVSFGQSYAPTNGGSVTINPPPSNVTDAAFKISI